MKTITNQAMWSHLLIVRVFYEEKCTQACETKSTKSLSGNGLNTPCRCGLSFKLIFCLEMLLLSEISNLIAVLFHNNLIVDCLNTQTLPLIHVVLKVVPEGRSMYIDVFIVRSMHGTVRLFENFLYLEVFISCFSCPHASFCLIY